MASAPPILTDDDIRRVRGQGAPSQPQPIPRVIQGPPREATPQTPEERGYTVARTTGQNIENQTGPDAVRRARAEADKAEIDAQAAREAADLRRRQQGTVDDAQQELRNVIDAANNAIRLSREGGVSGRDRWVGSVTRLFGGTALNDLDGALDTIRSNVAFTRLQRMRQESPTGGAVGNVSDSDLRLLASTIASLDRSQSDEQFESNLRRVIDTYQHVYNRLDEGRAGSAAPISQAAVSGGQGAGVAPLAPAGPGSPPTSPGSPSDPNRVQPGENMGQVGTLPMGGPQGGGSLGLTEGERFEIDPRAPQVAAQLRSALRGGASRDQLIRIIEQLGPVSVDQRAWIDRAIQPENRRYWRNHDPIPQGFGRRPASLTDRAGQVFGDMMGNGADTAGVAHFADAASLGAPSLFSENYRNRLATLGEEHPVASIAGTVAGGIIAPGGPRPGMSLGVQSLRSAGQGAVYGFNESGGSPENALIGGTIGAAVPGAFNVAGRAAGRVRNALLPRANVADPEAVSIANALNDENIPGSRPLLDPTVRDRMAYLESSVGSGSPIREGLNATRQGVEDRAGQLHGPGVPQEGPVMGQRIQGAGTRFRDESRIPLQRDYARANELAGETPIYAREFVSEIDQQIAQLNRSPKRNRAVINYLNTIRADFVDGEGNLLPRRIDDIRELRTDLNGEISRRRLTQTPAERLMGRALDRARADIERDLNDIHSLNPGSEAGQRAQQAWNIYRRTDIAWGLRSRELRQVVERLVGPADNPFGGGQVMNNIRSWLANDPVRAGRMMSKLNASERADLTATYAESLGREAADEPFSPALFLRRTRALPDASRRLLFGEEGAQSIANLRTISQALKDTQGRLNNTRSGVVSNWRGWLRDLTTGGPLGAAVGAASGGSVVASGLAGATIGGATALGGMAIRRMSAKALMSRDLSRWLAAAPRATTATAIRRHIDRLSIVARTNPSISQEVTGLRQALLNAVNDNLPQAGRMAASPDQGPDQPDQ